jgi:hypothetical protein
LLKSQFDKQIAHQTTNFLGAYLVAASAMPISLFFMRAIYRELFGVEALSSWLLANRISDVSTQLIGIYMAQLILPNISISIGRPTLSVSFKAVLSYITTLTVALTLVALFALLFLNQSVIKIIPNMFFESKNIIILYMVGDILRVYVSFLYFFSLASNRPWLGASIELSNAAIFAGALALGLFVGLDSAPGYAYVASNFVLMTAGLLGAFLVGRCSRVRNRG